MINEFKVVVRTDSSELTRQQSIVFAQQLSLDVIDETIELEAAQASFEMLDNKLTLNLLLDNKSSRLGFDLNDGEVAIRAVKVSKSNEVVAKAIGCKSFYRPKVLDATAGMGRDGLIMAMLGCEVVLQERNFAIYQLLNNALQRLKGDHDFAVIANRISLNECNSLDVLQPENIAAQKIEVIYLDPMFPERKKSALVKKEMRLFKLLAGTDLDADELFQRALNSCVKRVVVKRPKGAPFLANKKPSHEIVAKKFRYDVYLTH